MITRPPARRRSMLLGQEEVERLGDLEVLRVAGNHGDRHARQVAQHDGGVVGGGEARVPGGGGVRVAKGGQPERLRSLAATEQRPGQDLDQPVVVRVDLDHGVARADRGDHRAVVGQRGHVRGQDRLGHQRPGRVVDQDVGLLRAQGGQGGGGAVVAGAAAGDDLADLVVATVGRPSPGPARGGRAPSRRRSRRPPASAASPRSSAPGSDGRRSGSAAWASAARSGCRCRRPGPRRRCASW